MWIPSEGLSAAEVTCNIRNLNSGIIKAKWRVDALEKSECFIDILYTASPIFLSGFQQNTGGINGIITAG